jgi:hypothetical protein
LAGLFFYLTFDEVFEIHEKITDFISKEHLVDLGWYDNSVFYWTLIFVPLILLAILFLINFIKEIKDSLVSEYFLLGLIFFVLVIIFEIIGGFLSQTNFGYTIMTFEEIFELLGASFFLIALIEFSKYILD